MSEEEEGTCHHRPMQKLATKFVLKHMEEVVAALDAAMAADDDDDELCFKCISLAIYASLVTNLMYRTDPEHRMIMHECFSDVLDKIPGAVEQIEADEDGVQIGHA